MVHLIVGKLIQYDDIICAERHHKYSRTNTLLASSFHCANQPKASKRSKVDIVLVQAEKHPHCIC